MNKVLTGRVAVLGVAALAGLQGCSPPPASQTTSDGSSVPVESEAPHVSTNGKVVASGPAISEGHGEHPASGEQAVMRMGSHGMVVVGENDLLLSHLPLYSPPHDRQILTPATIQSADIREAVRKWRVNYTGMITVVPENFDLNRLDPNAAEPITLFVADLYKGHFERGGKRVFEKVTFELERPVFHRPVMEQGQATREVTYSYVRHATAAYLVRSIGPRPGKDRILKVPARSDMKQGELLVLESEDAANDAINVRRGDGTSIRFRTISELYLETADFAARL